MFRSLYVNHQLNYDEVVRRLNFWAREPYSPRRDAALKMLAGSLDRNRTNLYFEEK
jgi:hypothetical protein